MAIRIVVLGRLSLQGTTQTEVGSTLSSLSVKGVPLLVLELWLADIRFSRVELLSRNRAMDAILVLSLCLALVHWYHPSKKLIHLFGAPIS